MSLCRYLLSTVFAATLLAAPAMAAEPQTGAGNGAAVALVAKSPLVKSAMTFIRTQADKIADPTLKAATLDALTNRDLCVKHRVGLDAAGKAKILETLKAEGLVDVEDDAKFPGGLIAGVFPPLRDEAGACPHLPQTYDSAPGSVFGGHHSHPGGLPVHVAVNLSSALSLADNYRRVYGFTGHSGLPEVVASGASSPSPAKADIFIDQDIVIAAPIWHDWAKTIVFQWTETGAEFPELNFGGNGKTDNWGVAGTTKTGAHHIIGVAETIKRGLPPAFVVAHASAHSAPTGAIGEASVVNWIRAASILAGVDPVAKGYLSKDELGRLRLPALRKLSTASIQKVLPNQPNLLVEYVLHNLSDADYTYTGPAMADAQVLLRLLAPAFGYEPGDAAAYNLKYRNPALAHLGAERVQIIFAGKGLDGVRAELDRLRKAGVI